MNYNRYLDQTYLEPVVQLLAASSHHKFSSFIQQFSFELFDQRGKYKFTECKIDNFITQIIPFLDEFAEFITGK